MNHPHVSGTIFGAVFLPAYPIHFLFVFKHGTFLQLVRANKLETKKTNKLKNPSWGSDVINQQSVRGNEPAGRFPSELILSKSNLWPRCQHH